jgi:hypothetical protein
MQPVSDDEFRTILKTVRNRVRLLGQARPRLNGVTCFCATSVRVPRTLDTLRLCAELCEFDEVVLATSEVVPEVKDMPVRVVPIPRLESKLSYSQFILNELKNIIRTEYVLIVQDDGFILNPGAWDSAFYDFDYIGAPWPPTLIFRTGSVVLQLNNRVGNGGFSFRSRRLLRECSINQLFRPEYRTVDEDVLICHFNHANLVAKGIRFADLATAARFSGETPAQDGLHLNEVFGFHGKMVMDALAAMIRRH